MRKIEESDQVDRSSIYSCYWIFSALILPAAHPSDGYTIMVINSSKKRMLII